MKVENEIGVGNVRNGVWGVLEIRRVVVVVRGNKDMRVWVGVVRWG